MLATTSTSLVRHPRQHEPSKWLTNIALTGMRGIDPVTSQLVETGLPRVRQAYENMKTLVEMQGTDVYSCLRLVVYVTDMAQYRPMCNQVQEEIWGSDPSRYPPRTIIEVTALNQDDIVEVEGTFYAPHLSQKKCPGKKRC